MESIPLKVTCKYCEMNFYSIFHVPNHKDELFAVVS